MPDHLPALDDFVSAATVGATAYETVEPNFPYPLAAGRAPWPTWAIRFDLAVQGRSLLRVNAVSKSIVRPVNSHLL